MDELSVHFLTFIEKPELREANSDKNLVREKYRYGFNGKEKDAKDEWGGNSHYDYGFRIYNPEIGKFLSVDPLTKSYAMLTPYQFASNRPIDGIDLDGLEYFTIHVKIHDGTGISVLSVEDYTSMTDRQIVATHQMPAARFYKYYSKSFGSKGRGVAYIYHYYAGDKEVDTRYSFENKKSITRHGLYYGKESITHYGRSSSFQPTSEMAAWNYYDFTKTPIDEVDALAKQHDIEYAEYSEGYKGWSSDLRTIDADKKFIKGIYKYLKRTEKPGYVDKLTGRLPSEEALAAARNALTFFVGVYSKKELEKSCRKWKKERSEQQGHNRNEVREFKRLIRKYSK